jgi:hypothetical protein
MPWALAGNGLTYKSGACARRAAFGRSATGAAEAGRPCPRAGMSKAPTVSFSCRGGVYLVGWAGVARLISTAVSLGTVCPVAVSNELAGLSVEAEPPFDDVSVVYTAQACLDLLARQDIQVVLGLILHGWPGCGLGGHVPAQDMLASAVPP